MKNDTVLTKYASSPLVLRAAGLALILALLLIIWAIVDFAFWKKNDTVEGNSDSVSADEEVKGAEACTPIPEDIFVSPVSGQRTWFLLGEQFDTREQTLELTATVNPSYPDSLDDMQISYEVTDTDVDGNFMKTSADGVLSAAIDTTQLNPGAYSALATAHNECSEIKSPPVAFNVSYPIYVTWTIDWEGNDVKQQYLDDMGALATKHDMPMTHFFNPRIYATSKVSSQRRAYLTDWVKDRRDENGDSIQLHLHMYFDMVRTAGVTSQTSPAWGWNTNDGYDVLVSGYSNEDLNTIIDWAIGEFEANDLGTPTMFRAGGWFADEGTLEVLQANGFLADSSGRTNFTLGSNKAVSPWNLGVTTQPYQPSTTDQNSSAFPNMTLWELPNNGGDSWAFSQDEMFARFRKNYAGGILTEKRVVTYLSHPDWFYTDKPKMDGLLTSIEQELYADDIGPVIFSTLDTVYEVWAGD